MHSQPNTTWQQDMFTATVADLIHVTRNHIVNGIPMNESDLAVAKSAISRIDHMLKGELPIFPAQPAVQEPVNQQTLAALKVAHRTMRTYVDHYQDGHTDYERNVAAIAAAEAAQPEKDTRAMCMLVAEAAYRCATGRGAVQSDVLRQIVDDVLQQPASTQPVAVPVISGTAQPSLLLRCLHFLADLNGCEWIKGDGPGEVDMRQRAKALQEQLAQRMRGSDRVADAEANPVAAVPAGWRGVMQKVRDAMLKRLDHPMDAANMIAWGETTVRAIESALAYLEAEQESKPVAVPDERAAFEAWLQEGIDGTDTVRPAAETVEAYFAVWEARAQLSAAQKPEGV